jgi:hypothetical protein
LLLLLLLLQLATASTPVGDTYSEKLGALPLQADCPSIGKHVRFCRWL